MSINIVKETEDELADFQALFSYLSPNSKANSEATSNGKGGRSYDLKSGGAKKLEAEVERLKLENEKIVQKTRRGWQGSIFIGRSLSSSSRWRYWWSFLFFDFRTQRGVSQRCFSQRGIRCREMRERDEGLEREARG
ncbi:hypothetical protein DKX38_018593 [Salix brachista]|uniref:Uncharacterized protein n=1 Tax=Salix brachista TaxID=2182728 RepID=A0A5N5KNG9_9ROSI|nr:hypothetical protein DKX38_018593 [Salix brachista]